MTKLEVKNITAASVKPQQVVLDEGKTTYVVLTVTISKVGTEEGELIVSYGGNVEIVKIKVIGLPPPSSGSSEGGEGETSGAGGGGGEESGVEGEETGSAVGANKLVLYIHADVMLAGKAEGELDNVVYEYTFETHYIYTFRLEISKRNPYSSDLDYTGTIKLMTWLLPVLRGCTIQ